MGCGHVEIIFISISDKRDKRSGGPDDVIGAALRIAWEFLQAIEGNLDFFSFSFLFQATFVGYHQYARLLI